MLEIAEQLPSIYFLANTFLVLAIVLCLVFFFIRRKKNDEENKGLRSTVQLLIDQLDLTKRMLQSEVNLNNNLGSKVNQIENVNHELWIQIRRLETLLESRESSLKLTEEEFRNLQSAISKMKWQPDYKGLHSKVAPRLNAAESYMRRLKDKISPHHQNLLAEAFKYVQVMAKESSDAHKELDNLN